jgi:hypothetical protein
MFLELFNVKSSNKRMFYSEVFQSYEYIKIITWLIILVF